MTTDVSNTIINFAPVKDSGVQNLRWTRTRHRGQKACVICHKRKIRCDLDEGSGSCTNCRAQDLECLPYERRRRQYSVSSSSPVRRHSKQAQANKRTSWIEETSFTPPKTTGEFISFPGNHVLDSRSRGPVPCCPSSAGGERDSPTNSQSFIGRPEYYPGELAIPETSEREPPPTSSPSDISLAFLRLYKAFDVPPRAVRDSLISNFTKYFSPWMPVVEAAELKRLGLDATESIRDRGSSLLLAQALFVAGSRVQSSRASFASSSDFYNRAKALFFAEHEPDPLKVIRALCLLQWYNPSGPEFVSIHSGGYWLRIAVGLAFQIGLHREPDPRLEDCKLRRRVFWTLFSRDCLISTAHGRPPAINLDDCDIRWPTVNDFPENNKQARLFVAYVDICSILGRLGQAVFPSGHLRSPHLYIDRELRRWIWQLPHDLQLNNAAEYDLETRQLHLPFFTALEILYSPSPSTNSCSAAAALASSCVGRICEDFLARDELRHVTAYVTFYLQIAALSQLACFKVPGLRESSKAELTEIRNSMLELGKTRHSARRMLALLDRLLGVMSRGDAADEQDAQLDTSPDQLSYFEPIGPELCPKWTLIVSGTYTAQHQPSPTEDSSMTKPVPLTNEQLGPLVNSSNFLGTCNPSATADIGAAAQGMQPLPAGVELSNIPDWDFTGMEDFDDNLDGLLGLGSS